MQPAPNSKPDNLFGVCHALGEMFAINPLFMRLAFMVAILIDFEAAIGVYAMVGAMLIASSVLAGKRAVGSSLM